MTGSRTLIFSLAAGCGALLTPHGHAGAPCREATGVTIEDSIAAALEYQICQYPESQYRDIYKLFMQDYFGPGHILADTASAGAYLRRELQSEGPFEGPPYEKTGYKGNFFRVNLSLIRDGIVPYDTFFDAFTRSVNGIVPPDGAEWMATWEMIDGVIAGKDLHFPDEAEDREELGRQFAEGNYVVHHSRRYNESVRFRYRIMSKDLFEKEILPLLDKK